MKQRCSTPFGYEATQAKRWLKVPTKILCETRGLQLFWVIRGGIGLTRRLGAKTSAHRAPNERFDTLPRTRASYERGCQGKKLLPAPREDAGMVTYIQPHHTLRGVIGLAALARRAFQRRGQPQLLVPTRRFHEAVVLDAIRLRSYAS